MRILACLVPLFALAAAPVANKHADHTRCPPNRAKLVVDKEKPLIHPLDQEPGARQEIAVQRTDAHGCVTPIIVRDDIGGPAR